ncbi:MAG: SusC/RagA family TonB-linked outer membrane protein [Flavobacterium psychrophilum]|nr:MAG: SusC/RagA family TonB-linked outer membrane protein [Flavobacterium psychrophilum]
MFTLLLAFFIQFSFAQEKTITGVVTDGSGLPIPGANVSVEGSTQGGIQTDFDGKYSITASVGQKLVFTYVGLGTRIVPVGASSTINVKMEDDTTILNDVVVEAYRTTTRTTSNVAVTTVTSKTIEGRPNASFIQTLQGQVPGLNISTGSGQPGANSTVILRGYGSVNGNVEPLYVIDGVPLNADNFRSINPNDIESLSVLKDAGATSIYGNRGANGVIIVKTKKGSYESPLAIKYTGITSFSTIQGNDYNKMNSQQLLTLERSKGSGFGATGGASGGPMTDAEISAYPVNTDWYDVIFRTGLTQNHVLSLTNGSKNVSSFTSFGYFDQEGMLQNTDLKRFNFRNNLNGKSNNDRFNYSTAVTINYSVRNEASNLGTGAININPIIAANGGAPYIDPKWYTNGQDLYNWYSDNVVPTGATDIHQNGTLLLSPLMLMDRLKTGTLRTNELKMIANVQGSYKLTDELTLATSIGSDFTEAIGLNVQDPLSFNSEVFRQANQEFVGFQNESFAREFAFNFNTSLNYNKVFAEKHTIDASVFTEYYKAHQKGFQYTQNGLDPRLFSPGNGAGFIGHNPFPADGTGSPAYYVPDVSAGLANAGLFSYFGSADYDYDKRFGLSATVRRDASYRFAETNRWGTFWSVSGRWNIDRESFMQGSPFDMLKLRGSYGTTGNQNISGQSIFSAANASRTLYASGSGYSNLPSYLIGQLGNNDLKWETIEQANVGVDFEAWQHRLRGTFEVYQKTTKDLYQTIPISAVNGTYGILGNSGSLRNSGIEALLAYDAIRNNDGLNLTLTFNGSYNRNQMIEIPNAEGLTNNGNVVNHEGGPLNEYYLIKYAGVNPTNGQLLFYDKNGNLTENPDPESDRRFTNRSAVPVYQGGFGFDISYKGFYATTQFNYVMDIDRFDFDLDGLQDPNSIGQFNMSTDLFNAWTPDNRITDIPALDLRNKAMDSASDRYLKDASYLRLRYATIGYSFTPEMLAKTPFKGIKAFVQGENLVTWTKWRGWDAESNRAGDQAQYPTPRIVSVGLELQF